MASFSAETAPVRHVSPIRRVNHAAFLIAVILGASLLLVRGAEAQEGAVINADGTAGTSTAETDPAVDADGPNVVYDDLDLGPGTNVIGPGASLLGPDGTYAVTDAPPAAVTMGDSRPLAPEPEVVAETTTEPIVADTATETDADGDNYPDAQEVEIGLDPNNVDTDGDGVADGDEVNIYGTDPFTWDLDGDGVSDGDELYNTRTDPLVWDEHGTEAVGSGDETVAAAEPLATTAMATAIASPTPTKRPSGPTPRTRIAMAMGTTTATRRIWPPIPSMP